MVPHVVALYRREKTSNLLLNCDIPCFATVQCFKNKCCVIMFATIDCCLNMKISQLMLVKLLNSCSVLLCIINCYVDVHPLGALKWTVYIALLLEIVLQIFLGACHRTAIFIPFLCLIACKYHFQMNAHIHSAPGPLITLLCFLFTSPLGNLPLHSLLPMTLCVKRVLPHLYAKPLMK